MIRTSSVLALLVACGGPKPAPTSSPPVATSTPRPSLDVELPVVDGFTPAEPRDEVVVVRPAGSVTFPPAVSSPLRLAVDKRVSYRTFVETAISATAAGYTSFELLAKTARGAMASATFIVVPRKAMREDAAPRDPRAPGADLEGQIEDAKHEGRPKRVDVALGTRGPSNQAIGTTTVDPTPVRDPAVRLVMSITKSDVVLWSFSGLEGTLQAPKLRTSSALSLRAALAEILARRWSSKPSEKWITIMADADVTMERVVELMGAARANADGTPLFPAFMVSSEVE